MKWAWHTAQETKNTSNNLVWKPKEKRPLGRPSHIWLKKGKAIPATGHEGP
jgi:hypothetical protein